MRFLLKVLAAPVVAVLAVSVWLCVGVLYCAGMVMGHLCSIIISADTQSYLSSCKIYNCVCSRMQQSFIHPILGCSQNFICIICCF